MLGDSWHHYPNFWKSDSKSHYIDSWYGMRIVTAMPVLIAFEHKRQVKLILKKTKPYKKDRMRGPHISIMS